MEGIVKADDGGAAGRLPHDLDGVFYRLRAAVDQQRFLGKGAGRDFAEPAGELDVTLGQHHRAPGVNQPLRLLADGLDHPGMAVTDVHHADAGREVDIGVPVHVGEHGAAP